jgi:hypothetical protein
VPVEEPIPRNPVLARLAAEKSMSQEDYDEVLGEVLPPPLDDHPDDAKEGGGDSGEDNDAPPPSFTDGDDDNDDDDFAPLEDGPRGSAAPPPMDADFEPMEDGPRGSTPPPPMDDDDFAPLEDGPRGSAAPPPMDADFEPLEDGPRASAASPPGVTFATDAPAKRSLFSKLTKKGFSRVSKKAMKASKSMGKASMKASKSMSKKAMEATMKATTVAKGKVEKVLFAPEWENTAYFFHVKVPGRTYLLAVRSEMEAETWLASIQANLDTLNDRE